MPRAEHSHRRMKWLHGLPLALLAAVSCQQAMAVDIDYDARRSAALRRCDDPQHHGRVEEARNCYRPLLRDGNALTRAEAAFALGDLRTANDEFRVAVADNQRAVLPRLRWGKMYLEAGQPADAERLFKEAVEIDGKDVGALLALASLGVEPSGEEPSAEDQPTDEAADGIPRVLAENPNLVEAQLLLARLELARGRFDNAVKAAQRALQLAQQQKLPPLEAQTLLAAWKWCAIAIRPSGRAPRWNTTRTTARCSRRWGPSRCAAGAMSRPMSGCSGQSKCSRISGRPGVNSP